MLVFKSTKDRIYGVSEGCTVHTTHFMRRNNGYNEANQGLDLGRAIQASS